MWTEQKYTNTCKSDPFQEEKHLPKPFCGDFHGCMYGVWSQNGFKISPQRVMSRAPSQWLSLSSPEKPDGFPKSIPLVLGMIDISPIKNISKTVILGMAGHRFPGAPSAPSGAPASESSRTRTAEGFRIRWDLPMYCSLC